MKDSQLRRSSRRVVRGLSPAHQPDKLSKGQIQGQQEHWKAHAVAAGILLVAFAVLEWQVEHSSGGDYFQRLGLRLLQKANAAGAGEPLPLVVVDISNRPEFRLDASGYTARRPLLQLVENLSRYDPKCIAVDIDLSPDEVGAFPPETVELLDR